MRRRSSHVPAAGVVQPAPRGSPAAGLPAWISPQLTQLVDAAPDGDGWLHELKYDGYRMHARLDRGAVKLLTRTGLDWTHKYPAIAKAVAALDARQAYLDGELCGVGTDGITSFNIVQLASDSANAAALVFFLFDLLHLDGKPDRTWDNFRVNRSENLDAPGEPWPRPAVSPRSSPSMCEAAQHLRACSSS